MSEHGIGRALRAALLELGLEDWIPIPEAVSTPEVVEAVGGGDAVVAVRRALQALVESGEVVLYRGRWEADPQPVPPAEAPALLVAVRRGGAHRRCSLR